MLFLCLDFSVTDVELAAAHCSVIHLSIGYRALHGRLTVRAYVLACLGALASESHAALAIETLWQFPTLPHRFLPCLFWPCALTFDFC